MNTLIISDLHLTSDFDEDKYRYLMGLIAKYTSIIINGDLWSIYSDTWETFYNSNWRPFIDELGEKDLIYLEGNHDPTFYQKSGHPIHQGIFRDHTFTTRGNTFFITHGKFLDEEDSFTLKTSKLTRRSGIDKILRYPTEDYLSNDKHLSKVVHNLLSRKNKSYSQNIERNGADYLVFGHTHSPEVNHEYKYINTGYIGYGHSSYLKINDDTFELVLERY